VLLNPERLTTVGTPTRYLLTGLIFCGVCGGRMQARPRDAHTRRYVCAGHRPGHQLAILAQPVDDLVAERALELLTTPEIRETLVAQSGRRDNGSLDERSPSWDRRRADCRRSTTTTTSKAR
jgi:recombinase-like zinc beta ribbon protein